MLRAKEKNRKLPLTSSAMMTYFSSTHNITIKLTFYISSGTLGQIERVHRINKWEDKQTHTQKPVTKHSSRQYLKWSKKGGGAECECRSHRAFEWSSRQAPSRKWKEKLFIVGCIWKWDCFFFVIANSSVHSECSFSNSSIYGGAKSVPLKNANLQW